MKPTNLLFELIHSMSPAEVQHFRRISSLQQGEKNYLKIFNYLSGQNDYDEEKVKHHFRNETFVKHFPSEKNQLLHHVLRSLRNYRCENDLRARMNEKVKNIQILFNKSLYRMARRELNQLKSLAAKHELFFTLLEIIELEKVVIDLEVRFDESDMKELDLLMEEKEKVLSMIANLLEFENILAELISSYNSYSFVRDSSERHRLERLVTDKRLRNEENSLSHKARITAGMCICFALRLLHRDKELLTEAQRTIRLYEEDDSFISEHPMNYIMCYSFLARSYAINGQYNECFTCLDKIHSLQLSPAFEPVIHQIAIFTRTVINDSMFYLYTGQFEKQRKALPYIEKGMAKYGEKIPPDEKCTLHFIIFMTHYGCEDRSSALVWLNRIINEKEKNVRPDLFRICKLVNLILHFELGNVSLINYLFKANQRYYDHRTSVYPFEKVFMKYFRKYTLPGKNTGSVKVLEKLKTELADAFSDPYQRFALEYFDFEAWVNARIHGVSFREALVSGRRSMQ